MSSSFSSSGDGTRDGFLRLSSTNGGYTGSLDWARIQSTSFCGSRVSFFAGTFSPLDPVAGYFFSILLAAR
jgi:hypothetical protein